MSGEDDMLELEYERMPGDVRKWMYRVYSIVMLVLILWTGWYVFIDDRPK